MAYASTSDVSVRLGRAISDATETDQVDAWLDDIEAIITARLGNVNALIAAGSMSGDTLTMVEANAVVRKVKNPDGKQNERIDDYSYGLNADAARGDLFLTDAEWELLAPDVRPTGAFSITPGGTRSLRRWDTPDSWTPIP